MIILEYLKLIKVSNKNDKLKESKFENETIGNIAKIKKENDEIKIILNENTKKVR